MFSASTGSAPSAPDVLQWLKEVLGFPIINAYGSTEGGMITINNRMTECATQQCALEGKSPSSQR